MYKEWKKSWIRFSELLYKNYGKMYFLYRVKLKPADTSSVLYHPNPKHNFKPDMKLYLLFVL